MFEKIFKNKNFVLFLTKQDTQTIISEIPLKI